MSLGEHSKAHSIERAKPITLKGLLPLAKKTVRDDRLFHQSKARPISLKRVVGSVFPNLSRPIFVVGAARSGTTFLGGCLAEIPEISYHFEPVATKAAARYVYDELWSHAKAKWFYRSVYAWLMRIHGNGDLRFAEKTPRNCCIIPFLNKAFPDAQFIHIIRDGRDAALSFSKKPWLSAKSANSGKYEPGGYPIGPYARFWVKPERRAEYESTSDLHRCIWAWKGLTQPAIEATEDFSPSKLLEIRYESLGANLEKEAKRVLDFLEIRDAKSRQAFERKLLTFKPSLIGQWKEELSEQQLAVVYKEAGELLRRLNYV